MVKPARKGATARATRGVQKKVPTKAKSRAAVGGMRAPPTKSKSKAPLKRGPRALSTKAKTKTKAQAGTTRARAAKTPLQRNSKAPPSSGQAAAKGAARAAASALPIAANAKPTAVATAPRRAAPRTLAGMRYQVRSQGLMQYALEQGKASECARPHPAAARWLHGSVLHWHACVQACRQRVATG